MNIFKKTTSTRLRLMLLSVIVVTLGVIVSIFFSSRDSLNEQEKKAARISQKSNISIGKIYHTAIRNGNTEWTMEASTAEYTNSNQEAILKDLSVTFFLKNNEKAYLTAKEGVLITDAFDIQVTGNVVMKSQGYSIKTDQLNYKHDERLIFSQTPVKIEGESFWITADTLKLDLNTNKTFLAGHVKGIFDENFKL